MADLVSGSHVFDDVETRGTEIVAVHDAPRTNTGPEIGLYDGERWTGYYEGQMVTQQWSHEAQRWFQMGPLFQDTQLTATNVKALLATNITLVTAPPAGYAVYPTLVHFFNDFGTAAFAQPAGSDALAIRYTASTEIQELGSEAQMTSLIEAVADAALTVPITAVAVPVAATALVLDNNGASEYTTGDGTLSVRVYYDILPMAAFT